MFSGTLAYSSTPERQPAVLPGGAPGQVARVHGARSARRPLRHGRGPQAHQSSPRDGPGPRARGCAGREPRARGASPTAGCRTSSSGSRSSMRRCSRASRRAGARHVLRYVGSVGADGNAQVGVVELRLARLRHIALTDNIVRFQTARYDQNPLIVQGRAPARRSRRRACSATCCASAPTSGPSCECRARTGHGVRARQRRQRRGRLRHPRAVRGGPRRPCDGHALRGAGCRDPLDPRRRAGPALDAERNTAGMAVLALQRSLDCRRLRTRGHQGHPARLGPRRLGGLRRRGRGGGRGAGRGTARPTRLLHFAMQGEAVASGSVHVDNTSRRRSMAGWC